MQTLSVPKRAGRGLKRLRKALFRGWPGLFKRRLARRVRRRLSPPSQPGELPSVSIIVTGHSGSEGLKRLLAGLQNHTDYPDYEVVLVEPGSAEVADPFAEASGAKVVAGGSPAEDKNRGARAASADLLLFINDGVEPFESGWLRELMACVIPPGTGAAAAYPLPTPMEKSVLMAWYRGLRFRRADGEEHPKASRQGEDTLGEDVQCPASPSDCLLVWRQAFEAAGGFSWGYRDGGEDVELGIRLLSAGYGTVSSGKSVVLREAPQGGYIGEEDRRLLFERRGPLLHRSIKLDRLNVGGFWSQSAAHLAIAGDENHEFNGSGWRISRVTDDLRSVPPDADYALSLNPELPLSRLSETTTIAWVRDRVEYWISRPHFERYDAVLAASEEIRDVVEAETCKAAHPFPEANGEQLAEILRERANSLSFCIKTGIPNWKNARHWGDLHFARALQRQLERLGHPCLVQNAGEWEGPKGLQYDVSIHLRGRGPCSPKPGQLNVLWSISRPGELTPEECDLHDLVFVASKRLAEHLMGKTSTPVFALEQATDPGTFFPDHDPAHDREVVFVGNSRNVERRILADLLPTGRDLAVWGRNWRKFIDEKYIVGEYLPNREVRKAYSSAAIVLNDHWDDMREHGFVSNRIYDALACGAFIISDHLPELGEEFDGAVATYRTPRQLEGLIDYYLDHPREREERGRHGREIVLSRHTFDHRAEEILHRIQERLEDPEIKRRLHNLP